jgi:hypothetical protein
MPDEVRFSTCFHQLKNWVKQTETLPLCSLSWAAPTASYVRNFCGTKVTFVQKSDKKKIENRKRFLTRITSCKLCTENRKSTEINSDLSYKTNMSVLNPNSDDEPQECPLCMEFLELDDINFYPCSCGYQVSSFIHFYFKILKTCDCLNSVRVNRTFLMGAAGVRSHTK